MKIAFLPYYGEFGWLVLNHIRYVHSHPATEKIVCCERGQECLYPSATGFFYDWKHPVPDNARCGSGSVHYNRQVAKADSDTTSALRRLYPDFKALRQSRYDCHWHTSDSIKFKPAPLPVLPSVDIAICPRYREFVKEKNWPHWQRFAEAMKSQGLTVGLVGAKATSFDLTATAKAWDHPDGETAGTCDILNHCRLYFGSDTGVSHLAAMMDVPMVIMRKEVHGNPDQTGVMQRANKSHYTRLPEAAWDEPEQVINAILERLAKLA